ncbi:MAG: hypothetical protein ACLFVP_06325 [Candidatus Bathyarchaeia archaeon]
MVITDENPSEMQLRINDASRDDFRMKKFSYATGAGLFYALLVKQE